MYITNFVGKQKSRNKKIFIQPITDLTSLCADLIYFGASFLYSTPQTDCQIDGGEFSAGAMENDAEATIAGSAGKEGYFEITSRRASFKVKATKAGSEMNKSKMINYEERKNGGKVLCIPFQFKCRAGQTLSKPQN